ncbi:MAG: alkaline phosphatase D family protein [bacterium]|nr:alkaline phosphatase D family protein [bacterium]
MRTRGIIVAFVVTVVAHGAVAAPTPAQKCQDAIASAAGKYFGTRAKTLGKCRDGRAASGTPADCASDAGVVTSLAKAQDKLTKSVTAKCPGATIADADLGLACDGAATVGDVVTCVVAAVHGPRADELIDTGYDDAGQLADAGVRACQKTIGKAIQKAANARLKLRRACAKKAVFSGSGARCPDEKTLAKLDKAREKLIAVVETKCTDAQVLDAAIEFGGECGDTRAGAPVHPFSFLTFLRVGVTNANAIPPVARLSRCLAAASAVQGDTGAAAVYPLSDAAPFSYGVAAGDATPSAFIAWTRADGPGPVTLEVSTDARFTNVVQTQPGLVPNPARDNVVKTDVSGLSAATTYFYRFTQGADTSRTGRVRTAPSPSSTAPLHFAFTGDSNAFFMPYSVLEGITRDAPDLWLYIGDTIYGDDPRSGTGIATTLPEYWTKYRENREDRALRDLMASTGTVSMTDDHEVTNDYYGSPFGAFGPQIIAGNHAFRDWQPVREDGVDPMRLYRSFKWGDVAEFFVIDARQYRNPQAYLTQPACLSGGQPATLPPAGPCTTEINSPSRTYLGAAQKAWLKAGLQSSTAKWKFVMNGPLLTSLLFVPYDRWEGYAAERTEIMEFIRNPDGNPMTNDHVRNVVFLSTDIHAAIYNTGAANPGPAGGAIPEIVAGAIGMDPIYRELPPAVLGLVGSLPSLFPTVQYYDIDRRNYVSIVADTATAAVAYKDNNGEVIRTFTLTAE